MKTCLVVEDDPESLGWLNRIVQSAFPGVRIDGAGDLKAALAAAKQESYDLALIDLALPDGCGLDALRWFKRQAVQTTCVVITVMGEDSWIVGALAAGADGYLLKEYPETVLTKQLADLANGIPALSPSIAKRIMEHFQRTGPSSMHEGVLTRREKQTLALISRGYRNSEVAAQLGVAPSTVASHVKSIYHKLGISSRAEASWYATQFGL